MTHINVVNSKCYFCPKPINGVAVSWTEINNYQLNPNEEGCHKLLLHPKCAVMLGERLIGDAFRADKNVESKKTVIQLVESRMKYA